MATFDAVVLHVASNHFRSVSNIVAVVSHVVGLMYLRRGDLTTGMLSSSAGVLLPAGVFSIFAGALSKAVGVFVGILYCSDTIHFRTHPFVWGRRIGQSPSFDSSVFSHELHMAYSACAFVLTCSPRQRFVFLFSLRSFRLTDA